MHDTPDSPAPPDAEELPPAVQWLRDQAAAEAAQASARTQPDVTFTPLAEREARVVGGLRGNTRLTEGLDDEAATALLDWGEALGRLIVADTAGLDDAAAEDVLQARVRAARRLLLWVRDSTGQTTAETNLADAVALAHVVYGRQRPPDASPVVPVGYNSSASPVDQIALVRRVIEGQLPDEGSDHATLG